MVDSTNYVGVPSTEISPGVTIFGIPVIPATTGSSNSDFPQLPALEPLPQGSVGASPYSVITGPVSGAVNAATGAANAVAGAFNILTNPARVVTVIVGLLLMFAGFHLLGNSVITDAIANLKKVA